MEWRVVVNVGSKVILLVGVLCQDGRNAPPRCVVVKAGWQSR